MRWEYSKKHTVCAGGFELKFEASEKTASSQMWTVRVHLPLPSIDAATTRLRCGNADVELTVLPPSRLHSGPFAVSDDKSAGAAGCVAENGNGGSC